MTSLLAASGGLGWGFAHGAALFLLMRNTKFAIMVMMMISSSTGLAWCIIEPERKRQAIKQLRITGVRGASGDTLFVLSEYSSHSKPRTQQSKSVR